MTLLSKTTKFFLFATLCLSALLGATETSDSPASCDKADKKFSKIFSSDLKEKLTKKGNKYLDKIKSNLTPEKQAELISKIMNSDLPEAQKLALLDAIENLPVAGE